VYQPIPVVPLFRIATTNNVLVKCQTIHERVRLKFNVGVNEKQMRAIRSHEFSQRMISGSWNQTLVASEINHEIYFVFPQKCYQTQQADCVLHGHHCIVARG
jgi:hypothetical protein